MKSGTNSRTFATTIGVLMVLVALLLCVRLVIAQQLSPPTAVEPPRVYVPATPVPAFAPSTGGGAAVPGAYPTGAPMPYAAEPAAAYPPGSERKRQTEALRAEIDALVEQESYTRQLMSEYSRLVDEQERATIARELTNVVGKHFDIRQGVRERELQRLEAQLQALRDLHEKRASLRNEIVEERVRQLLRDLDGIGWGADGLDRLELDRGAGAGAPRSMMPSMSSPMGMMGAPMAGMPAGKGMPAGGGMAMPPGPPVMGMPRISPASRDNLANVNKSLNNLKQFGLAMHNYQDVHGAFAPPVVYGPDGKTPHSWRVALLPYLEQNELYKQYNLNEPWDSEHNLQLLDKMPAVFRDPSAPADSIFSSYYQVSGLKPEPGRNAWKPSDIWDGTSNTLMIVEAKRNIPWTKPDDIPYVSDRLPKFGGHHAGFFLAVLYDGSAHKFPLKLSDDTLRALITPNGGEPIDASALEEKPDPRRFPGGGGPPRGITLPTPSAPPALPGGPGGAPVPTDRAPISDQNQPSSSLPGSGGGGAPAAPEPDAPAVRSE